MMPVIRIPDAVYERLQQHATPFVDTPATVIERLLDAYEKKSTTLAKLIPQQAKSHPEVESESDENGVNNQHSPVWPGFWFVNVGDSSSRTWEDCVKYGFLAAGWGRKFSDPLGKLALGSKVFAYMAGAGYVGYGEVIRPACPVEQFTPEGYTQPLLELPLEAEEMDHSLGDLNKCEWVVGVKWHKTFTREEAKTFSGAFALPNIVCKLTQKKTLDFLCSEFGVQHAVT
jgi:hypothetical protein